MACDPVFIDKAYGHGTDQLALGLKRKAIMLNGMHVYVQSAPCFINPVFPQHNPLPNIGPYFDGGDMS